MMRWRRSRQRADVASCRCGNGRAVAVLYRSMHYGSDRASARWTDYTDAVTRTSDLVRSLLPGRAGPARSHLRPPARGGHPDVASTTPGPLRRPRGFSIATGRDDRATLVEPNPCAQPAVALRRRRMPSAGQQRTTPVGARPTKASGTSWELLPDKLRRGPLASAASRPAGGGGRLALDNHRPRRRRLPPPPAGAVAAEPWGRDSRSRLRALPEFAVTAGPQPARAR
jgi:hypothetical protein